MPLQKIVISRWLQTIAFKMGTSAFYLPNGLDFNVFGTDIPMDKRDPQQIMMLYHKYNWKGASDGLKAIEKVQLYHPGLKLIIFGVPILLRDCRSGLNIIKDHLKINLESFITAAQCF